MPNAVAPDPKKNILLAGISSRMQFMREESIHDSEMDSYVRFRGSFIVPNWDGVEENEIEYVIDNDNERTDKLANLFYKDVALGWIIAIRNHLDLPDIQLYKGLRLKIPKKDWVDSVLLPQARKLRGRTI